MSLLSETKVDYIYESAENRTAKTKTNQSFRSDQATRLGSMVREMGRSLVSNIIKRIKGDNAR